MFTVKLVDGCRIGCLARYPACREHAQTNTSQSGWTVDDYPEPGAIPTGASTLL